MSIVDKFIINPCDKDGTCLVKPTCVLLTRFPWSRRKKCYIYAKYIKRHDLVSRLLEAIANIIAWGFVMLTAAFLTTIVVLGCIKFYEIITGFIF